MKLFPADHTTLGEEAKIVNWPWTDPWGGQFMTHHRAAIESDHARQLFAEAMRAPKPPAIN